MRTRTNSWIGSDSGFHFLPKCSFSVSSGNHLLFPFLSEKQVFLVSDWGMRAAKDSVQTLPLLFVSRLIITQYKNHETMTMREELGVRNATVYWHICMRMRTIREAS